MDPIQDAVILLRAAGFVVKPPAQPRSLARRLEGQKWKPDGKTERLYWGPATDEDTDDPSTPHLAMLVQPTAECGCCTCHRWRAVPPRWGALGITGIAENKEQANPRAEQALDYIVRQAPCR